MKFSKILSSSKGLSLIEVLVSLTILSIILLGIMNFFHQAYSFTNLNQKKTAAVNVARNALTFIEQASGENSFISIKNRIEKNPSEKAILLICNDEYTLKWENESALNCSSITVNNIPYDVEITPVIDETYTEYFIPINVEVGWEVNNNTYETSVEGAIKSEDLR